MPGIGVLRSMTIWLLFTFLLLFKTGFAIYFTSNINWKPYSPKYLSTEVASFYRFRWEASVPVPLSHLPWHRQGEGTRGKSITLYVRKFSQTPYPMRHVWFITGGPGCSTDGVERALSTQLPDTAVYLMDNRGLEASEAICTYKQSSVCLTKVKKCFEDYAHPSYTISLHETAQDYNYLSQIILRSNGGEVFLYGSSYGSILAYRAFKYNPNLYSGLLLEAFMPEFELDEDVDIRQYVTQSCLKSELCRVKIPEMSSEFADALIPAILDPKNNNSCKLLFQFMTKMSKANSLHSTINAAVRFMAHKNSKARGVILPMLYSLAYCPSIDDFVKFSTHYSDMIDNYTDDIPNSNVMKSMVQNDVEDAKTPTLHASLYPQTNKFVGAHIRLSEYFSNNPDNAKKCLDRGFLNEHNWSDTCGMIADYKDNFKEFFYHSQPARPRHEDLAQSPTRIVILTGKWDTQTPHDLAQLEFEKLVAPNKFIFTADHAAHGVVETADLPGFSLNLALDFVMTGNPAARAEISEIFAQHNEDADGVWRALQKENSSIKQLWSLQVKSMNYSWKSFGMVLLGTMLPPILSFLLFRKIKLK